MKGHSRMRNQAVGLLGVLVALLAMPVQAQQALNCTVMRWEKDTTRTTQTAAALQWTWLSRDSVRVNCTKPQPLPGRVDTVIVTRVDTVFLPPAPPPQDTTRPPPADTTPTPPPGGGFAPPDLAVMDFNDPAKDITLGIDAPPLPGRFHRIDPTGGINGSRALRADISSAANNGFEMYGPKWPNRGKVFTRWYYRFQGVPGGNVKGMRFHVGSGAGNAGEVYGGSPCWAFDIEEQLCFDVGLSYTNNTANCPALANGAWHWIEVEYNRNAGPNVEVRLWCDGKAVVLPNGAAPHPWAPSPPTFPPLQFVGGDRATNTPTTLRIARAENGATVTGSLGLFETVSTAGGSFTVWIDNVAVSSQRIGP